MQLQRGLQVGHTVEKTHWLKRLIRAVLLLEILYLTVFNLALQLPVTQTLINAVKPDKFHVSWERAWTWYPFRVHARGISANGQARSQQWQVETTAAAASISLLPLLLKRVWISNIAVEDISYKQRPRLKPDKDYASVIEFFPPIEGREISAAITTPREKKRPWRLSIDNLSTSGSYEYWIMQFRGKAAGKLNADLNFETRGGPFSLENGQVDVELDTLYVNNEYEMFKRGTVQGELAFEPFVPRDNKGVNLLKFLSLETDVNIDVNSLAFINIFTQSFNRTTIDGSGHVRGHFRMEQGHVLDGTDLTIDADTLQVNVLDHDIEGRGTVKLISSTSTRHLLNLAVHYSDLEVIHSGDKHPLLTGENLWLRITGPGELFQTDNREFDEYRNMTFNIEGLAAPDLALFQHYLPEQWPFQLHGGVGTLQGMASVSHNAVDIELFLTSDKADMGLRDYRFYSNLDAALILNNPSTVTHNTSIAGSYIKLSDSQLTQQGGKQAPPWNASFVINDGNFSVLPEDQKQDKERLKDLLQVLGQSDSKQMLANLRGFMAFESEVSSLAWIGILLNDDYHTSVGGDGQVTGVVHLADGRPAPGTDIEVLSDSLAVDILDYTSHGDGRISMRVDEGDLGPDLSLEISLRDADLMRQNEFENAAYIQHVDLNVSALIEDLSLDKTENKTSLGLKILSARVTDMSIFSSYLPADSPLQFTNGTAALSADILLQKDDARGWVNLESKDLELSADEQSIRADLSANIQLVGGVPAEMTFDISGSQVNMTEVQVIGEHERFSEEDWSAQFTLVRGETTWKKPLRLNAEATLNIVDSRPVVAMFNNKKERPRWLLDILTIKDIVGVAEVEIADQQIVIPLAHAISDQLEVGAKARISEQRRDGVIYARYKKLDAVIKIDDGDRNTDIIRAREKYDSYPIAE